MDFELGPVGAHGTRESFLDQVSQVAADRAGAWQALAEVLDRPTPQVVDRLRSGALVELWRAGSRWLGDDSQMFTGALMSLDVYARGAARRDAAEDLRSYREEHATHIGDGTDLSRRVTDLAATCREEADRWRAGDFGAGRDSRAQQHKTLEGGLAEELLAIGADAGRHASTHLWRTLGKVILALVTVETGRDYQRAVLGDSRARRRG